MLLQASFTDQNASHAKSRLVMIDDNPLEHLIMKRLCQRLKIFTEANYHYDARAVLNQLRQEQAHNLPDIILLDLQMPEFDGWDFLEEFSRIYTSLPKNIKIYIFSSSINPVDITRSATYPFVCDFISKPMKQETLQQLYQQFDEAA
ncbi:response regulator [Mucilaginibacter sp. CSA2-8R]|uniref:response regulator n=1 Tax=Mucilaginibacter sp. CSA2-8R TaxID=3141542 RepID=UPI00315D7FFB